MENIERAVEILTEPTEKAGKKNGKGVPERDRNRSIEKVSKGNPLNNEVLTNLKESKTS